MGLKGWGSHDSSLSGSEGKDGDASQQDVYIKNMNDKGRLFSISIDVRSFKANLHLPIASANVIVRVVLPPELVRLATSSCNASATVMTPLLTHPPIQVNKGTEVIIPNGYLALELPVSAHSMATMLTQQPIITMQIVHRDKYAIDSTLGLAFVPMKQLLEHPIIEGYVPVIRKAIGLGSQLDEVKIGFLHMILAIKEMGSMRGLKTNKLKDVFVNQFAVEEQHKNEYSFNVKNFQNHTTEYKDIDSTFSNLEDGDEVSEAYLVARDNECVSKTKKKIKIKPSKKPLFNMDDDNISSSLSNGDLENNNDYITHSKYELAWEFDLWQQLEESKWRANLKAQENVRMNVIEEKWKKQKKDLSIEMCNTQVEQLNLESKLRAKLLKLEKRERAIILVEEDMSKRKKSLEEDYVNQTSNAQVALKRLQAESEHRIKLECNKYVALQEQYAMLEQQLIISNASLVNLEKQFVTFRIAQQDTIEAQLVGQVITLEQHYKNLQRKGVLAIESKNDYKTQVIQNAKGNKKEEDQHSIYNDQFKLREVQANTTTKGMVTHLMQQKANLLKTGVYNKHDRLIK
ncbi:hypothetical protein CY35_16G071600, partial [Sphagnum magellanicum]